MCAALRGVVDEGVLQGALQIMEREFKPWHLSAAASAAASEAAPAEAASARRVSAGLASLGAAALKTEQLMRRAKFCFAIARDELL